VIDKLRVFFNHPGFIGANVANLRHSLLQIPEHRRPSAHVVFTAHSIPSAMAQACAYQIQLEEASRLVARAAGVDQYSLAFQSRSGPPQVPWLEPDILDHLGKLAERGVHDVLVMPIGFVSDHMEVVYDLDIEAAGRAGDLGLNMIRVPTVGTAPAFVDMIRDLVLERMAADPARQALGTLGPAPDICHANCCQSGHVNDA
jgi:protoporphyrin/coproporphyrin ferrochelatase